MDDRIRAFEQACGGSRVAQSSLNEARTGPPQTVADRRRPHQRRHLVTLLLKTAQQTAAGIARGSGQGDPHRFDSGAVPMARMGLGPGLRGQ